MRSDIIWSLNSMTLTLCMLGNFACFHFIGCFFFSFFCACVFAVFFAFVCFFIYLSQINVQ